MEKKTLPRAYGGNLFENGVCRQGASEAITTTFTTSIANRMSLSYDNHCAPVNSKIIFNNSFILQSLQHKGF